MSILALLHKTVCQTFCHRKTLANLYAIAMDFFIVCVCVCVFAGVS